MTTRDRDACAAQPWRRYDDLALTPILAAALDLFQERGYHGATVRDIARRAQLTMPTLYYHHSSKEGILLALLDLAMDDLLTHAHAALDSAGQRGDSRLVNLVTTVVMHMTKRQALARLHPEYRFLGEGHRRHYLRRRAELNVLVDEILACGVRDGSFRPQGLRFTTEAILGMLQAIVDWHDPEGHLSPDQIAAEYAAAVLRFAGVESMTTRHSPRLAITDGALAPLRGGTMTLPLSATKWDRYDDLELTPILDAALHAFQEKGYHGTTVRDIANRAGLTMPALYYHHGNKEGILLALLDMAMQDLLLHLRLAREEAAHDVQRHFENAVSVVVLHVTHRHQFARLHPEYRFLSPDARTTYVAQRDVVVTEVVDAIQAGVDAGVYHVGDVRSATRAVLGLLQSITEWYRPGHHDHDIEEIVEENVEYARRLVGATPAA